MTIHQPSRKLLAAATLCAVSLLLNGCFFMPGKFASQLRLQGDGQFTFAYAGELYFLPLAEDEEEGESAEFLADSCYDEETYEERDCSEDELADQRQAWEESQASLAEREEREAREMSQLIGGIDTSDPEADAKFAELLQRQKGWKKVVAKGDGLFEVEYEISSTIGHAFAFPAVENFAMANSLVTISPRGDGTVRIDASGFGPGIGNPASMMMLGAQSIGGGTLSPSSEAEDMPEINGSFTIHTEGQILANNTDRGPTADQGGQRLDWTIDGMTTATPMALIRLAE